MCQSVFDRGSLVAFHGCRRTAEGVGGGASRKLSVLLPEVERWMERLGSALGWHGALSADVILGPEGPVFIDVNPRLVEPANAYLAGVDLVGAMMDLATGGHPDRQPEGRAGVATHQLLLAILGAAADGKGRRGVVTELVHALGRSDGFRSSREELTPVRHDLRSLLPVLIAAFATMTVPTSWKWFSSGSVANYALSDEGWQRLQAVPPEVEA
jgi:hypothetical protein